MPETQGANSYTGCKPINVYLILGIKLRFLPQVDFTIN